jgi:hypothetical protein
VKEECLSRLILFGEGPLHRALNEFIEHFHLERNIKERGMYFCFRRRPRLSQVVASAAANGSVACFDTTHVRLDIFTIRAVDLVYSPKLKTNSSVNKQCM